jgi:hypothetical protein
MTWVVGSRKVEKNQKPVYVPPFTEKYPLELGSQILYLKRQLTDYHVEHVIKSRTLHVFVPWLGAAAAESRERSDRNEGCGQ